MIAIDLSKQQALDADPKAIQQINFTGNLNGNDNNRSLFFITEEVKETILDFSQDLLKYCDLARVPKVSDRKVFDRTACSTILFCFNIISI